MFNIRLWFEEYLIRFCWIMTKKRYIKDEVNYLLNYIWFVFHIREYKDFYRRCVENGSNDPEIWYSRRTGFIHMGNKIRFWDDSPGEQTYNLDMSGWRWAIGSNADTK